MSPRDDRRLLRNLMAGVAPPTTEQRLRARGRLLEAIREQEDRHRSVAPSAHKDRPSAHTRSGKIVARRRWRRQIAVAVAASCMVLVAVGAIWRPDTTSPPTASRGAERPGGMAATEVPQLPPTLDFRRPEERPGAPEPQMVAPNPELATEAASRPLPVREHRGVDLTDQVGSAGRGGHTSIFAPTERGPWPVIVVVPGTRVPMKEYERAARALATAGAVVSFPDWRGDTEQVTEEVIRRGAGLVSCALRHAGAAGVHYGGSAASTAIVGYDVGAQVGALVALGPERYDLTRCVEEDKDPAVSVFFGVAADLQCGSPDCESAEDTAMQEYPPELDPFSQVEALTSTHFALLEPSDNRTSRHVSARAFAGALQRAGNLVEVATLPTQDVGEFYESGPIRQQIARQIVHQARVLASQS